MFAYYRVHEFDVFRDHSRAMEEECVNDDEESLIQSFVNEEVQGPSLSLCYSSRADLYATITYTNLEDELKLVKESKCFASVSQLIGLVGSICRKSGCGAAIKDISCHTNCGYAVKLTWNCENKHRYLYIGLTIA